MVFTKDIARFAALTAITLGLGTQAQAQLLCPIDAQCPPPPSGGTIVKETTVVASDSHGPSTIPFAGSFVTLSVPKFDKAAYAALEGVPEADITLVGVELQLGLDVSQITVNIDNLQTNPCIASWTYSLAAQINANASLGTPLVGITPIAVSDVAIPLPSGDLSPQPPWNYTWTLAVDGGGPVVEAACFSATEMLANWLSSAGDTTADFQVATSAGFTFSDNCGNTAEEHTNTGSATVSVVYHYCVAKEVPPTETGCLCERPSPHYRRPGSLLLFPEFDNRMGNVSVVTVTNTDCTGAAGGQNVDVEFIYIDEDGCAEYNKTETLTPCDTLTFLTNFHNPNHEQGYVYAFAKNQDGDPIVWNHLIGSLLVISGFQAFDYGLNPVVFQGMGDQGTLTDIDMDGNRDLDGAEYEPAPDTILIPRFLGQDPPPAKGQVAGFRSQLILIALTGGRQFDTQVCFLFWNDNEEQFSAQHTFSCWEKPYLDEITFAFRNTYLKTTDHDLDEIIGADHRESGWICLQGCLATSAQESIMDPSIYAVLVERVGSFGVADLPFECGIRMNGALLPDHIFGDGDPTPVNGDNQ